MKTMSVFKVVMLLCVIMFILPGFSFAHCDTIDGPVIKDAKKAIDKGDVNLILIWVQKNDEASIKKAFEQTLTVRKLSPQAKELADNYFFDTLVRIHRAGEGVPFTGVKPAGSEVEPGIAAADMAIDSGNIDGLLKELTSDISKGVLERFNRAMGKKKHAAHSVDAGREFVASYVEFIHYVEGIHMSINKKHGHHGHMSEPTATGDSEHKH